jgi:catechol 2,3-dioxygenase-like lactoylglutathione lyase family enzyme
MSENSQDKKGLGHYLQGIQHFGITVDNMAKSLEFYIELLGGKLAIAGDGFAGEVLHNTLFQKEDIEAYTQGINPEDSAFPTSKMVARMPWMCDLFPLAIPCWN